MEILYYIQYIISWFYHIAIQSDITYALLKIVIIIGLVYLLVLREYTWFLLLCVIILLFECFRWIKENNRGFSELQQMIPSSIWTDDDNNSGSSATAGINDKDALTRGISISSREGFSLGLPKIIKGDDTGKDHRRSNKFIEEDSNDFTDKYFKSKQCSIGSGIGGISMFGSNELIGSSRIANIIKIYDFENKSTVNENTGDVTKDNETKKKRAIYFTDCVYNPIKRSYGKVGTFRKVNSNEYVDGDFRDMKILMYNDINDKIININRCLQRFDIGLLFDTLSDITADRSKRITLSDKNNKGNPIETKDEEKDFVFRSLINGETNEKKMENIQSLNSGPAGDNLNDKTYSRLLESINSDERYKNSPAMKQRHLSIYSKVYGFRKRIDEILSMMRKQTKNDASLLFTIRVDEVIVKELRMILGYLAIVIQTFNIIQYEMKSGIYSKYLDQPSPPISMDVIAQVPSSSITDIVNIFKLPHDDDTYNSNDEKRYLYGITYYFGGRPYESPPPKA